MYMEPKSNTNPSKSDTPALSVQPSWGTYGKNAEEFRKYIEHEVLMIIRKLTESGETDQTRIQEIAKMTLDIIRPGMTVDELYQNAVKLDDKFSELAPVVIKLMQEYEEKYNRKAVLAVSKLVREGKYDEAQTVVKKVLQFKMEN